VFCAEMGDCVSKGHSRSIPQSVQSRKGVDTSGLLVTLFANPPQKNFLGRVRLYGSFDEADRTIDLYPDLGQGLGEQPLSSSIR